MGKSSILVIFAVVLTFHSLVEGLDPEQKKLCLKLTRRTLKNMMKSFNACNEKLQYHKVSGEEYQKKIGCIVRCVMEMQNVLDANGIMTSEALKKSIESQVPAEYVQITHDKLNECIVKNPLDPKDENCKTYLNMGTCMQGAMVDICGEPPMM